MNNLNKKPHYIREVIHEHISTEHLQISYL